MEQGLPPPLHPSAHPGLKKRAPPNAASGGGARRGSSKPRGKGSTQRRRSRSLEPEGSQDGEGDGDDGLEYEEDENRLLCVCQQPYSADSAMVSCDTCGEWFHLRCVGLTQVGT